MEFNATILISTISFIIFTIIMNKILYEPMSKIVEKRRQYLEKNSGEVNKNQNKIQEIVEDKNSKIKEAKKTAKNNVALEMERTKNLKSEMVQTKKTELSKKVENYKIKLEDEKNTISKELNEKATELSDEILSNVLKGGR